MNFGVLFWVYLNCGPYWEIGKFQFKFKVSHLFCIFLLGWFGVYVFWMRVYDFCVYGKFRRSSFFCQVEFATVLRLMQTTDQIQKKKLIGDEKNIEKFCVRQKSRKWEKKAKCSEWIRQFNGHTFFGGISSYRFSRIKFTVLRCV